MIQNKLTNQLKTRVALSTLYKKGCFIMSFKIPCGGFRLDEKSFSLDENGVLSVSGGGGGDSMKNLNVVAFSGGSNSSMPDSCNVTYDELRGWIENGVPVFAVWNANKYNTDEKVVEFFTGIEVGSSALYFYYQDYELGKQKFKYLSDGRMEPVIST